MQKNLSVIFYGVSRAKIFLFLKKSIIKYLKGLA